MRHLGDITKINGADVPPVDIICGGSPCQDLSVAGKRAGLAGERSGLFMDQIRIIKEMRENDRKSGRAVEHLRPRLMLWENVVGALSSNNGEDFRAVLEETARVVEPDAVIPGLPDGQSWSNSGAVMGDGWSLAWRVHDAQFWGVPQRRRRIALVADFGGASAPALLFERKGLSGNTKPREKEGQGTADSASGSPDRAVLGFDAYQHHGYRENITTGPLTAGQNDSVRGDTPLVYDASRRHDCHEMGEVAETVQAQYGTGGNNTPIVLEGNGSRESHHGDGYKESEVMFTLNTVENHAVCYSQDAYDKYTENESAASIKASGANYGGGSEVLVKQSGLYAQEIIKGSARNTSRKGRSL